MDTSYTSSYLFTIDIGILLRHLKNTYEAYLGKYIDLHQVHVYRGSSWVSSFRLKWAVTPTQWHYIDMMTFGMTRPGGNAMGVFQWTEESDVGGLQVAFCCQSMRAKTSVSVGKSLKQIPVYMVEVDRFSNPASVYIFLSLCISGLIYVRLVKSVTGRGLL